MGGVSKTAVDSITGGNPQASLEAKVERLTKLVHILWKEAERLEGIVKVIPEGLQIKTGISEIKGQRILVEAPGKREFYT